MSAPDVGPPPAGVTLRLARCAADVIELTAFRGRTAELGQVASARGIVLPALGRIGVHPHGLSLSVRPGRWLLLTAPTAGRAVLRDWEEGAGGSGAVVDHSSAFVALVLSGPAVREMLSRGCRLDLGGDAFPEGRAAATIMVQVSVILAALSGSMLLLTPATTARHMHEWLVTASQPFGLSLAPEASLADFCGDDRV